MTLYRSLAPAAALRWGGLAAAAVAILDQVTKALAHAALFSNPRIVEVTSFFNLVPVWNRGVSFGIFADGPEITRWLLSVFALVVSVILGLWMARGGRRLLEAILHEVEVVVQRRARRYQVLGERRTPSPHSNQVKLT